MRIANESIERILSASTSVYSEKGLDWLRRLKREREEWKRGVERGYYPDVGDIAAFQDELGHGE